MGKDHAEKHRYIYDSAALYEAVQAFCETHRGYGPKCASEVLYVQDAILSVMFAGICVRNCGVWLRDGTDVVCHALAGPDPQGYWHGITNDGKVLRWHSDEIAERGDDEKW